jgi:hypothetical protein
VLRKNTPIHRRRTHVRYDALGDAGSATRPDVPKVADPEAAVGDTHSAGRTCADRGVGRGGGRRRRARAGICGRLDIPGCQCAVGRAAASARDVGVDRRRDTRIVPRADASPLRYGAAMAGEPRRLMPGKCTCGPPPEECISDTETVTQASDEGMGFSLEPAVEQHRNGSVGHQGPAHRRGGCQVSV